MQLVNSGARLAERGATPACSGSHTHVVQFYEDDAFLCQAVADFMSAGLVAGAAGLVFATAAHREGLLAALTARGVAVDRACRSGVLTLLDADQVLDAIRVDGVLDDARVRQVAGELLDRAAALAEGHAVHAYGEMVDLLWRRGDPDGAFRLESIWDELIRGRAVSLLCGCSIQNFADASESERFLEICRLHQQAVPTERYTTADAGGRMLEVSRLQQKAAALESESAARRELELQLRDALARQEMLLRRERRARAEAEEANRAKRDFLAVMSHELRTPLNAIAGFAELLELEVHGPVTEPQRDSLERIQRSQRHLLTLIDEVLVYARMESGKLRFEISDFPLRDALLTADAGVAAQMRARGLDYACTPCDPDVLVRADGEKVQQILLNLLTNAMKFTRAGGGVRVETEVEEGRVLVRVRDGGIGIPAEKLELIFDAFSQVDNRLSRAHEGVGLGLAISRELARGMAGDLEVESSPGIGSTFTLVLPAGGGERRV